MLEYELKDFLISSDEWKIIEELCRVFKVKFIFYFILLNTFIILINKFL